MNILLISPSPIEAITSSMIRTLALARGLQESGAKIDCMVIPFNILQSQMKENDFLQNINVIRTDSNAVYDRVAVDQGNQKNIGKVILRNIFRKIWHSTFVYDNTYMIAKKISIHKLPVRHYDIVISSSDPKSSHIVVKTLKRQGLSYGKWIQYWGDPLAIDITQKTIWPKFILKHIEKKLLCGADKIVYVSPFTLKEQQRLFPKYKDRMKFVPIAYMEEENFPQTSNDRFVIGYYGDYTSKVRNLLPFYEACKALEENVDVGIYGDSDLKLSSTEHIHVFPRGMVEEHKKIADLCVCVMNTSGTQIPGKLYHLAGTNKKILVVLDGENMNEMVEYLKGFHRFYLCKNNTVSIKQKILEIMKDQRVFQPKRELKYDYIAKELIR